METTAAKAKGRSKDCNNGRDRINGKDCNNSGDRDNGRDRNNGKDHNNGRGRNAKPIMVNPTKSTPAIPALASQDVAADNCHAFAGVQIPKWDHVFKTASLGKAKSEMPKTYRELEIDTEHSSISRDILLCSVSITKEIVRGVINANLVESD